MSENQDDQGIALGDVGGLLSAFTSRRDLMGGLLGMVAGSAPFLMARPAPAAPSDVKGSPNVAVRIYQNKSGFYTLYSNGRIWDNTNGTEVVSGVDQYGPPSGKFKSAPSVQGRAKGSPYVPVDILFDTTGTYVLFADGSVRRPNGGAGTEPFPRLRCEWFSPNTKSAGVNWSNNTATWTPAFSAVPAMLFLRTEPNDNDKVRLHINGQAGLNVTATGATWPGYGSFIAFVVGSA